MDNLELENKQDPEKGNSWNDWWDEVAKIERYKQQIEWSRAEALKQRQERINDWKESLLEDVNNLNRLTKVKDEKLVKDVLDSLWYNSLDEALQENWLLLNNKEKAEIKWMSKDELEEWYNERKAKDIHQLAIQEAEKSFSDLTEDELIIAKKNFEKITKWQTLTLEEAREYADMAALYATKDKIIKRTSKWFVDLSWNLDMSNPKSKWGKDIVDSIIDNW